MTKARWKRLSGALRRVMAVFAPPPRLTVSEWADRYRRLSPEASAEPGPWSTDRAPYQREMMDAVCEPGMKVVTLKTSSQVGKTENINNIVGYFVDVDPCPILVVQPTLEIAGAWSKDRLAPMVRDCPRLSLKVQDAKSKTSGNTLLHKRFPGGHITVAGANSPASLAGRPIRIVIFDEVDRFPASAGSEGDPVGLGKKRNVTFHNGIVVESSTPTIAEISRIEKSYEESDQRRYWVPCPHCGEKHLLEWKNVQWERTEDGEHLPETAAHYCPHCGAAETDNDLPGMLARGEWRKGRPEVQGHAGFAINELYSPWRKYADTVKDFLEAKGDPERLKVWVNTALGEVWTEAKTVGSVEILLERRENYDAELIPMGGVVITAGVDVQDDRLEVELVAWGKDMESWSLGKAVIVGDTSKPEVWNDLDAGLLRTFQHESGLRLRIVATGVDTGHRTDEVYAYCKPRFGRRVFALKGAGGQGKPIASRPSKNNAGKVNLYQVGTDTAKSQIAAQLATEAPGPGYCHFPATADRSYFEQLLAEHLVPVRKNGQVARVWRIKKSGLRNESLDCRVYALAALKITGIDLNATVERFMARVDKPGETEKVKTAGSRRPKRIRSEGIRAA